MFAAYALVSRFDQMLIDSGRSPSEVEKMHVRRTGKAKAALEAFVSSHPGVKPIVVSGPPSTALSEMARRQQFARLARNRGRGGYGSCSLRCSDRQRHRAFSSPVTR